MRLYGLLRVPGGPGGGCGRAPDMSALGGGPLIFTLRLGLSKRG